jgi:hypothetical protein
MSEPPPTPTAPVAIPAPTGFTPLLVSGVQKVPLNIETYGKEVITYDAVIGYSMETIGDDEYKPGIFIPNNYPTSPVFDVYICVDDNRERDTEKEVLLRADGWSRPTDALVWSIDHSMKDNQGADMVNHMFMKPLVGKKLYYTTDVDGTLKTDTSIGFTDTSLYLEGHVYITPAGTNYICREVTPENLKSIYDQYNPPTAPTAPVTKMSSTKAELQAAAFDRLIHAAATRIQAEWRRYEEWPLRNTSAMTHEEFEKLFLPDGDHVRTWERDEEPDEDGGAASD